MKNKIYFLILFIGFIQVLSCKKDSKQPVANQPLKNGILSFSIEGELLNSNIDNTKNLISVVVPRTADQRSLKVDFVLANQATATINDTPVNSGSLINFSKVVYMTISSADKKQSSKFQIQVLTDLQYLGVTGNISAEKSLNKSYDFYYDQFDGSQYQFINCGPTVTTMALKWADSTSTKKPAEARITIPDNGGWWFTGDVQKYLSDNGVNTAIDTLDDLSSVVKRNIDNNNLVIFCLDMYYVPFNDVYYQHLEKFYTTSSTGWGHFILAKGYKQTNTGFFIETYDPYSEGKTYTVLTPGQLEGKDRYYSTSSIQTATNNWWPYAIIVAPKGHQVIASSKLKLNSFGKKIPMARGQ